MQPASRLPNRLRIAAVAAVLIACAGLAQAATPLVHLEIEDGEDRVSLQMPLSLVQAAATVLPAEIELDGRLEIDGADIEIAELHTLWQAVKDSPEETLLRLDSRTETVTVEKHGDMLLVRTLAPSGAQNAKVDLEIPFAVVDALFSAPPGHLDLAAALDALAARGEGPVLSIRDGEEHVRIWVEPGDLER